MKDAEEKKMAARKRKKGLDNADDTEEASGVRKKFKKKRKN